MELGFPVSVLDHSLLVLRNLDLLQAIDERAVAVVVFGITYTPDSAQSGALREMEWLVPPAEKRFAAMVQLARAGSC